MKTRRNGSSTWPFGSHRKTSCLQQRITSKALGIDVLGPTHHGIFKSIYFFDPNGHRVELAADIGTDEQYAELRRVAPMMLDEWSETKKAPQHAAWLHELARQEHGVEARIGE